MEEELEMTLKERAEQVRDEIETGANTAERVGGLLVDMCEAHEELKAEAERIARGLVALAELQSQDKAELTGLIEEKEASLKADINELAERITAEHDVTAELVESVRQALQDTIDANKNATDEALEVLNTTIGEIQAKLGEHKATLDDHEERLTVVEGSVEAIREDADKAREDADAAQQSAEQANTRLGEINAALENLSPDQQAALALSGKVESNTQKLSELEKEVGNITPTVNKDVKSVVIIGDSISTFRGYIPSNYNTYYPIGDVTAVSQTYWKKIIDKYGFELVQNLSYSGSCATAKDGNVSLYDRVKIAERADLYIIALGTNDSTQRRAIGSFDYDKNEDELDDSTFANAVIKGVKGIQNRYGANILLLSFGMGDDYANALQSIASNMNCEYKDVRPYYSYTSNVHPNSNGMTAVANSIIIKDEKEYKGFCVSDADGNVGMEYTEQGFGAAKVQPQFVEVLKQAGVATGSALDAVSAEVEETGFYFVDEQLNVGVRVDSDGIHSKNILEYEIIED